MHRADDDQTLAVRYKRGFGITGLVFGALLLALGLALGQWTSVAIGTVNVLLGLGFLTTPWWVVRGSTIEVKNLLGRTVKRHEFNRLSELEIKNGKVYLKADGRRIGGIGRSMARRKDWQSFALRLK